MPRVMLSNECWLKRKGMMLQENIYNKPGLRMMVDGMFYRLLVGCPWRDLPTCFDQWNSVYKNSMRGRKKGNVLLYLVENAFARLKHFRALATRYNKLKRNYQSRVAMACGFLWLPMS